MSEKKISGPLMDRSAKPLLWRLIFTSKCPACPLKKGSSQCTGEPSAKVGKRDEAARVIQRKQFEGTTLQTNADTGPAEIRKFCLIDETSTNLLKAAMNQMQLSAKAYHRILKLARTIADLAGSEQIQTIYVAEAIQYRPRQRI